MPVGRAGPFMSVSWGLTRYDKLDDCLWVFLTGLARSIMEISVEIDALGEWFLFGDMRPSHLVTGLEDAEVGWFVLGDVLLDGLVTRVADVLKVGDGSRIGLTLTLEPLLVNGGRSEALLRLVFDELDLSHPLEGLGLRTTFGSGDPPSAVVFGGTFGGTSGGLIGDTGERGTAVVGVLHSIGENIGDRGLVGLKAAAVSRIGVAH
jgi:hypothetical protein